MSIIRYAIFFLILDYYVIVNARREVIKLISNPRIPINARAVGEGINRNSRVAKQLNNRRGGH